MHWAYRINRGLLIVLGVATGAVKLAQMPDEMRIFLAAGFGTGLIMAFGVVQILGALLVIPDQTQRIGAGVLAVSFIVATGVLFANSMVPFGVVSVLFIGMAGWVAAKPRPWRSQ
jgi:hypothetical protein